MIPKPKFFLLTLVLCSVFLMFPASHSAMADPQDDELKALKAEIELLRQRVEDLESKRVQDRQEKMAKEMKVEDMSRETQMSFSSFIDRRIQSFSLYPTSKLFISGYGAAMFKNKKDEPSTFAAHFAPIFHYQLTDRIHFLMEPEFELEDDEVDVGLEIGEVDIFLNDYATLVAGKFLLPFNVFSERLHPTWINKMPSKPLLYGPSGFVPVLSDIGFQLRGGAPLPISKGSKFSYAFYVTNGPRFVEGEEHAEGEEPVGGEPAGFAALRDGGAEGEEGEAHLGFGGNFTDNNSNKAVGGRIGILPIWNVELGTSFMFADAGHDVDVFLFGLDGEYHYRGLELRGEYMYLDNDIEIDGDKDKHGYYLQGAYRLSTISIENKKVQDFVNRFEPVVRYGRVYKSGHDPQQLALGLEYWITSTVPIKLAYEINDNIPNAFLLQLAFGF